MTQLEDSDSFQIVPDPDKLYRHHRQQLSAMLDGELSPDQARFMLRRLQHDTELADCWERWQVCGDVLRGQRNALLPPDFARKVSAGIAGDALAPPERSRAGGPRLLRWGGGAALAASVAMAALLVGRQPGLSPELAPVEAAPALAEGSTPVRVPVPVPVPESGPAPERERLAAGGAALSGAVLAATAAEAPRRAAERRARRPAPQAVAAAAVDPLPEPAPRREAAAAAPAPQLEPERAGAALATLSRAGEGIGADPFQALPMTVASRPWPRASAPAAGYAVGLGDALPSAADWFRPFEPPRQVAADRFGLPPDAVPRLPAATAIGSDAIPGAAAAAPPAPPTALDFGPR